MKILEIRRHTMRRKPGQHLSQDGIELANYVSSLSSRKYDLVATSTIPRAIETAIAMGFEVNRTIEALGELPDEVFKECGWPISFGQVSNIVLSNRISSKFSQDQAEVWLNIANQISESQSALIVTHGLIVELGAVGCVPDAFHEIWGTGIGYCEGIKLILEGSVITDYEVLRVPDKYHCIEN